MAKEPEIYLTRLTAYIKDLLSKGPARLHGIVKRSGGAYPTDVLHALQILMDNHQVQQIHGTYILSDNNACIINSGGISNDERKLNIRKDKKFCSLSDPHPADYDWRFTYSTQKELVKRCLRLLKQNDSVALFGTPTILPHLAARDVHVILFDRSKSIISDLESQGYENHVVLHDLFKPVPGFSHNFDIIIADPPWYPTFQEAFILRASELLKTNGILLLSVLGWMTRPSALKDRIDILLFSLKAGFDVVEAVPSLLRYETPKFEYLALREKGIKPKNWRMGDLFVFRRATVAEVGLDITGPRDEPEWDEYCISKYKIKVRNKVEPGSVRFCYQSLTADYEFLDTVSRRSAIRSKIDVWTSNNRVFSVTGLRYLKNALSQYSSGQSIKEIITSITNEERLSTDESQALNKLMRELIKDSKIATA